MGRLIGRAEDCTHPAPTGKASVPAQRRCRREGRLECSETRHRRGDIRAEFRSFLTEHGVFIIGSDRSGRLLAIMVVDPDEDPVVIHAMALREVLRPTQMTPTNGGEINAEDTRWESAGSP